MPMINSPIGVMTVLVTVVAFWFWMQKTTGWRIFNIFPPLIFIYATPVFLSNFGAIPHENAAYASLKVYGLPIFICLMLVKVDFFGAIRVMGRGVFVMLIGSVSVVIGGVVAFVLGRNLSTPDGFFLAFPLPDDSWKAFGALAGSWIGGTGNMTAVHSALEGTPQHLTMAAAADQMVYLLWLPILLGSKAFAEKFNKWARVPAGRIEMMEKAALEAEEKELAPTMNSLVYLGLLVLGITWASFSLSQALPEVSLGGSVVVSENTWLIVLVTTFALMASATPARKLPSAQAIAMAIIYVYVARIGATMNLSEVSFQSIGAFIAMSYVWIFIHGACILLGAWLLRVDVHTLAIASAANIGGAASAPIVAAHHRQSLVPASILMAMIGYAIGNYLAIITGRIAQFLS